MSTRQTDNLLACYIAALLIATFVVVPSLAQDRFILAPERTNDVVFSTDRVLAVKDVDGIYTAKVSVQPVLREQSNLLVGGGYVFKSGKYFLTLDPQFSRTGISIENEQTESGVKQTVIIGDARAEHRLVYGWSSNAYADLTNLPEIVFNDASGNFLFRVVAPVAWDACGKDVSVKVSADKAQLIYEVDGAGAKYPIVVDPTTTLTRASTISGTVRKVGDVSGTYESARNVTDGIIVDTDVYTVGQTEADGASTQYAVYRSFIAIPIPNIFRSVSACTLYVNGSFDLSETDFDVKVYGASQYKSTLTTADFDQFDGWAASGAYTGTALSGAWNSSTYSADWNAIVFNAAGIDSLMAAVGDTLWIAMLSQEDVASSAPGSSVQEIVTFTNTGSSPYLSIEYLPIEENDTRKHIYRKNKQHLWKENSVPLYQP